MGLDFLTGQLNDKYDFYDYVYYMFGDKSAENDVSSTFRAKALA